MTDATVPGSRARAARAVVSGAAVIALLMGATPRVDATAGSPACAPGNSARAAIDSPVFVADRSHPGVERNELFVVLAAGDSGADGRGGLTRFILKSDATIVDADGAPVVDASTGAVRASVRAAWPAMPARAPVYTDLERGPLLREANAVVATNAALSSSRLGLAPADAAGRARLLGAALAAESAAPGTAVAVVGAGAPTAVVFVASGQGGLRAIDAANGSPLWTFMPLAQIAPARRTARGLAPAPAGGYLQVVRLDASRAAVFGTGAKERTVLVFSSESGYFGFDVSEPRAPLLLWRAGSAELRSSGVPSAPAAIARILIKGVAQNPAHLAAVVAGGDDPADGGAARAPRRGNRIFILDLISGAVLWRAGPAAPTDDVDASAELKLERMNRPLAAAIRVLDTDGDGYADRWYATDTGGRIWRFDVHNGEPPATLVTGGVWASLGVADGPGAGRVARRFLQTPDAAFIRDGGRMFVQVAVGSGGAGVQNYFYSLRDYDLAPLNAAAYGPGGWNAARVLSNASAWVDATDDPAPSPPPLAPGWRVRLARGESVSGAAQTFGGEVFFTTTTAAGVSATAPACGANPQQRALYVLDARSGGLPGHRAVKRMTLPSAERATRVAFAFPGGDTPHGCGGRGLACRPAPACFVGLSSCGSLPALSPQLTAWAELGGPP